MTVAARAGRAAPELGLIVKMEFTCRDLLELFQRVESYPWENQAWAVIGPHARERYRTELRAVRDQLQKTTFLAVRFVFATDVQSKLTDFVIIRGKTAAVDSCFMPQHAAEGFLLFFDSG